MNPEIAEEKSAMRTRMKALISRTTGTERGEWSSKITDRVTALSEWTASTTILAFLPMTGEVNTTAIITRSLEAGKIVGVPRMYGADIKFHRIESLDGPWEPHPYGLKEPPAAQPVIDPCSAGNGDICVITPGLCFDKRGNRLGFGRGYYDRLITGCRSVETRKIFFAAVCFDIQLVDWVPTDKHDCVLDLIVTESGIAWRQEKHRG